MSSFTETGLCPEILSAIAELGFEEPTPIQQETIPVLLTSKNDLIALAQTGTGKTAAYGLPLIQLTDMKSDKVQTLVLCPTRELCMQITSDLEKFSKFINNFKVIAVYGGANIAGQIKQLKDGGQIVVGTPGRVLDLIKRKVLKVNNIKWLVLDEADEMLNMGFKEDLDQILSDTPPHKQTLLFSATMPADILDIAEKYMDNPDEISVGKRNAGAENVNHEYYIVHAKDRYLALKRVVDINPKIYGIVFCRTRQETKDVADKLIADGYNADALHGDLSQSQRDHVMNRFRIKNLQLLVATDVAARGLDVHNLTHIINFNLPDELEAYIHRSGRTGRAGKRGVSISIIHTRETSKIATLEKMCSKKFERKMIPNGREVCEKQLFNLVDKVERIEVDETLIEQYLPAIFKKLDWLTREDLIKHFVSLEFNRFLEYYKDSEDLNVNVRKDEERGKRGERGERNRGGKMEFSRMRINIGHNVNLTIPRLIGVINEVTRNRDIVIGKVEIMRTFSIFEADIAHENEILKAFRNAVMDGEPLTVTPAGNDRRPERRPSSSGGRYSGSSKLSNDRFGKRDDGGFKGEKRRDSSRRWE